MGQPVGGMQTGNPGLKVLSAAQVYYVSQNRLIERTRDRLSAESWLLALTGDLDDTHIVVPGWRQ